MLSADTGVKRHIFTNDSRTLPFDSMASSTQQNVTTIGQRVKLVLEAEGRSQNSLEVELKRRGLLGDSRGAISSLISGRRGKHTMKVEMLVALAQILHVRLDWLATGELPMKRDGRVEQNPFETAMAWARNAGCREDAIQSAWTKYQAQEPALGVYEWSLAFDREARDLDMRKVPRPEVVVATHDAVRRQKKKLERGQAAQSREDAVEIPRARARRASGAP